MKLITTFILICIISINTLQAQAKTDDQIIHNELIEKMLNHEEIQQIHRYRPMVILTEDFCKEGQCEKYFSNHNNQLKFYSREQIFQRAYQSYLVIKSIDYDKKEISVKVHFKGKDKLFIIKN